MALEEITQAVLEAARTEAEHILKAAKKAADEKLDAARKAAEQDAERRYLLQTRAIEEEYARQLTRLQGAANKELLRRKNALLRRVFADAREAILALPEEKYAEVWSRLLKKTASDRGGMLRVHAEEQDLYERLASAVNAGRPDDQKVVIDTARFLAERGGFIFVSDVFQVDQTLGALLESLEYELAPVISAELFSEQAQREG